MTHWHHATLICLSHAALHAAGMQALHAAVHAAPMVLHHGGAVLLHGLGPHALPHVHLLLITCCTAADVNIVSTRGTALSILHISTQLRSSWLLHSTAMALQVVVVLVAEGELVVIMAVRVLVGMVLVVVLSRLLQ